MIRDYNLWFQSLPVFLNQTPRDINSFLSNEKFDDDLFLPCCNSLIDAGVYQQIQKDYDLNPNDQDNIKYKARADKLNSITVWKRISDLYSTYDLFPPELHCDNFEQGGIGDCYFVDMISLISNYGELLTRLFPIKKNNHGYYEVILFINGWKRVIVDDYIPMLFQNNVYEPLACKSKKYHNCFYNMLIEKAWAKVNKNYYNIYGGSSNDSLEVLTGYQGKRIFFDNNVNIARRNEILKDMKDGIRTYGHLHGINSKHHAYALLDIETIELNHINYQVLKVRNPWGEIGRDEFLEEHQDLLLKFQNSKAIVEDELMPKYKQFNNSLDTGIFFISSSYFFLLFSSYSKCYHMFNSSVIEFSLKFTLESLNKKWFMFHLIVKEESLVQINLTNHKFDNNGRMQFHFYYPLIKMSPFVSNDINKKLPVGEYFIEWHYYDLFPPEEILFWICYQGDVELEFKGISQYTQIFQHNYNFISNEGLIQQKSSYKLSEKLGERYQRQANLITFIENKYHININHEEEDRGFTITYKENDNVSFSFIIDDSDSTRNRVFSQNLDFQEFIFEGSTLARNRILGEGNIYLNNELVYTGKINYNLFPQYVQENNNNRLIMDVESKRFTLSQEINEDELITINQRRAGPFEGQLVKQTHNHALTKCLTLDRSKWICDHCDREFDNRHYSYYCSKCDFDFCNNNCLRPNIRSHEREPHFSSNFHFKSLQHKDPLVKVILFNRNHHFKCYSCLKNISLEHSIYYCTNCDFRLCQACQINETRGEEWQFHCCWHEHPLTFCKTKGYQKNPNEKKYNKDKVEILENSEFYFTCNHCGIEYSRKKDSFYCTACDFYICMKCYKDYFFYNRRDTENAVNVRMGNREVYPVHCRCFLDDKNIKKINCKKCNIELNLEEWTYYCSNCNSNFCQNCYRSHKVKFQNNIMIYDGYFENNLKHGFGITYKLNNEINYSGNWENGVFNLINDIPHFHPFIRRNFNETVQCDICLKLSNSFDTGLTCRPCNLNICDKCIIKINLKISENQNFFNNTKISKIQNSRKCYGCKKYSNYIFFAKRKPSSLSLDYYCLTCSIDN